jgi:hypothetical protein
VDPFFERANRPHGDISMISLCNRPADSHEVLQQRPTLARKAPTDYSS